MALERLIINNQIVAKHLLAQSHMDTLQAISWRDYHPVDYFPEPPQIAALDLDGYEKSLNKRQLDCTGDAVIGVATDCQNGRFISPRLLLVELRMNYKHGDNISLTSLQNKVNHSKTLLLDGTSPLHDKYYFVFTMYIAEQAKRYLRDEAQERGRMSEYCVVSVDEMKKILIDPSTLPYTPIHSKEEIQNSLMPLISKKKIDVKNLLIRLEYWVQELQSAFKSYNVDELHHLLDVLSPVISSLLANPMYQKLSEEDQLEIEIVTEEILNFKHLL